MRTSNRRHGFTLVELIIVMAIIVILTGLTVAFLPRVEESRKAASGASMLQGWLLIAKQRALRDKTPTGLRMVGNAYSMVHAPLNENDQAMGIGLFYIQQPEDFFGGMVELAEINSGTFSGVDFTGGFTDPEQFPVQSGDYIEFRGGGLVRQIVPNVGPNFLQWASPLPNRIQGTTEYRIIRSPRLLIGEQSPRLPRDVAIDYTMSKFLPGAAANKPGVQEILFAPSGEVLNTGCLHERIIIYVRDMSLADPKQGAPALVVIETRTGLIAVHPVDVNNPADIYSFANQARSSGM